MPPPSGEEAGKGSPHARSWQLRVPRLPAEAGCRKQAEAGLCQRRCKPRTCSLEARARPPLPLTSGGSPSCRPTLLHSRSDPE